MERLILLLAIAAAPVPASAHQYRTVEWYADHPDAMHQVLKLCRDNVGLAARNPNCTNAEEAGTIVTQRELDAKGGGRSGPSYWATHPSARAQLLRTCAVAHQRSLTLDPMTAKWCADAGADK